MIPTDKHDFRYFKTGQFFGGLGASQLMQVPNLDRANQASS